MTGGSAYTSTYKRIDKLLAESGQAIDPNAVHQALRPESVTVRRLTRGSRI